MAAEKKLVSPSVLLCAICLFVLGFLAMAGLLHLLLFHSVEDNLGLYATGRSEKLEILRRAHFGFSSAIFGSSHAQQGLDPRVVDANLAGSPLAVRLVNLGLNGGAQIEQRVMALAFLDHLKPPPSGVPCLVLLEVSAPPTFSLSFTSHPRQINILDWRSEQIARHFAPPQTSWLRRTHLAEASWEAAFYHANSMGMLSNRIFRPPYNEALIADETEHDRSGLLTEPENDLGKADVARSFGVALPVPVPVPITLEAGHIMLLDDLQHAPNGGKVQFVWVVMPLLSDLINFHIYPEEQPTPSGEIPIIDLGRPDLYPQIYVPSLWMDNQHLNEEGAKLVSTMLAKLLLNWARSHPVQQNCGG